MVSSYDVTRDPGSLDFLIYQVGKLLRILLAVTYCRTHVLDAIGQSLTLLEELQVSHSFTDEERYIAQTVYRHCRGRPTLNVTK